MSLRRRNSEKQQEFWIETVSVVKAPGHVFYERLNGPSQTSATVLSRTRWRVNSSKRPAPTTRWTKSCGPRSGRRS